VATDSLHQALRLFDDNRTRPRRHAPQSRLQDPAGLWFSAISTAQTVATLSNLVPSAGTLAPAFASGTETYTAAVPYATVAMTVTPTATDPNATITVDGNTVTSGTSSSLVGLSVGSNVITTVVVSQDLSVTKTYTLTVTRAPASSNANLTGLLPSAGSLTPAFASGTFTYTATVPYAVASMTVKPTAAAATSTITVDGNPVTSGSSSAAIPLNQGDNLITTVVTAEDGVTIQTYTLTVTRTADAGLTSLVASAGSLTPAFAVTTLNYTSTVTFPTTSMTVTPTASDALATLTIAVNGGSPVAITSGTPSDPISLSFGDNVIAIAVVSQDTTATNTYTLTVTRPVPSSNANLTALVPTPGTLIPTFATGTVNYKANVAYGSTIMNDPTITMTVKPTAAEANATITVNGTPVVSGASSAPISLGLGANIITTVVTAQDGVTVKTYNLTVTRAGVVANPGFEARGAVNPLPDGYDEFHQWGTEFWRQWQRTSNGGPCRIWNPGTPGCGRQTTGSIDEGFGGNAADGDYIMVVRSSSSDGANFTTTGATTNYFEALTQLLPVTFDPAMTYTLTVKVGRPPGSSTYTANWLGYAVQLAVGGTNVGGSTFAGSVTGGTLIAEDVNSLTVPVDGWVTAKVVYTPNPANAGLAGQPMQIRLCSLENPLNLTTQGIVAFDDVRFEGDVIPVGDLIPPTLAGTDVVDDKSGGPVPANTMVNYTVDFSEIMDASSVIAAGFTNAGTSTIVLGPITHLSGTIFTVQVTPTSTGTLQLQVPAGAVMKDISGNNLDTSAAIPDDTTLTVSPEVVADGTWILNNADYWNNPVDWAGGIVANGTDKTAFFTTDISPQTTIFANTPRSIGNITFTDSPTASHDLQLSGSSTLTLDSSSGAPVIDVTQTGRFLTLAGPIAGNDGLTKNGSGTLKIRLTGTLTGDTTVNTGVLEIGMGTGTYAGNISVASGAVLQYAVDDRKWQSKITLDGVISGAGALLKSGRTGLTLTQDNNYTGVTTVSGGVLLLNSANALPGGIGTSGGTSALTFNGGVLGLGVGDFTRSLAAAGTTTGVTFTGNGGWAAYGADRLVNLGGASAQIAWVTANTGFNAKVLIFGNVRSTTFTTSPAVLPSTHKVTLQNPIDLGTAVRTVQADDGTADVDGELSGLLSGTGGLTKTGAGTLVLSAGNTYTGATAVNAGTLLVNGNQATATGTVTVTAATLGGIGTIGGSVTLVNTGNLAPGTSAGTLSILGGLNLSAPANGGTGKLRFELDALANPSDMIATGTLTIGSGVLGLNDFVFTNLGGLQLGTYKLITSGGITGTLDAANLTGPIAAGLVGTLQITGNDVELVVITSYAAWAASKGLDDSDAAHSSAKAADPDGDGKNNLQEFGLDGDPLNGANDGKVVGKVATLVDTSAVLTLTLPVRAVATFSGAGEQVSAAIDGVVYNIQGSDDLADFTTMAVSEITGADATAIQLGLPALSSTAWTYRTFRTPGTVTEPDPKDFLRAGVVAAP
jgi:autotransporter-associated beta strand protein